MIKKIKEILAKIKKSLLNIIIGLVFFILGLLIGMNFERIENLFSSDNSSEKNASAQKRKTAVFKTVPEIKRLDPIELGYSVSWEFDTKHHVRAYFLYYGLDGEIEEKVMTGNVKNYDLENVFEKGNMYFIAVSAMDDNGNESEKSKAAMVFY